MVSRQQTGSSKFISIPTIILRLEATDKLLSVQICKCIPCSQGLPQPPRIVKDTMLAESRPKPGARVRQQRQALLEHGTAGRAVKSCKGL